MTQPPYSVVHRQKITKNEKDEETKESNETVNSPSQNKVSLSFGEAV